MPRQSVWPSFISVRLRAISLRLPVLAISRLSRPSLSAMLLVSALITAPVNAADTATPAANLAVKSISLTAAPKAKIAILGGTFVNDIFLHREQLLQQAFTIDTQVGRSPTIYYGVFAGVPFYYVHNHGGGDYVATWVALYDLGVQEAIGGATAGAINKKMRMYDYVVPQDFIEMNIDRPISIPVSVYRDPTMIPIPRFTPAMDEPLRTILLEETQRVVHARQQQFNAWPYQDIKVHNYGVVVQSRGGRFETLAEVEMMHRLGGDLVTMSIGTEMTYARMLGIHYATLVNVSNPAEGRGDWSFSDMPPLYKAINPMSLEIVLASLTRINALNQSDTPRSLQGLIDHPPMTSQ